MKGKSISLTAIRIVQKRRKNRIISISLILTILILLPGASRSFGTIIDDFESYTDFAPDMIFQTWKDGFGYISPPPGYFGNGTGSAIGHIEPPFVELNIVHGGWQSMPYFYDNGGAFGGEMYSEATRTYDNPQDLTAGGFNAIELWFYGQVNNDPEPMYLALEDQDGQIGVAHNGYAYNLTYEWWQRWSIPFADFIADNSDLDLGRIEGISIGFGDRNNPQFGGWGLVLFDDIILVPEPATVVLLAFGSVALLRRRRA